MIASRYGGISIVLDLLFILGSRITWSFWVSLIGNFIFFFAKKTS